MRLQSKWISELLLSGASVTGNVMGHDGPTGATHQLVDLPPEERVKAGANVDQLSSGALSQAEKPH